MRDDTRPSPFLWKNKKTARVRDRHFVTERVELRQPREVQTFTVTLPWNTVTGLEGPGGPLTPNTTKPNWKP